MCTDKEEHAVESGNGGSENAAAAGEPPRGADVVGQAKHPGVYDEEDDEWMDMESECVLTRGSMR